MADEAWPLVPLCMVAFAFPGSVLAAAAFEVRDAALSFGIAKQAA